MHGHRQFFPTFTSGVAVALQLLFVCSGIYSQTTTGTIVGTVTDSTGAVIPGAAITVIDEGTGAQRTAVANAQGGYAVSLLPVGGYTVKISQTGFQTETVTGIILQVNQTVREDIALKVGSQQQIIQVNASVPVLKTDRSDVGEVIGSQQVGELPLNGRNFIQMTTLVPGTVPTTELNPAQFGSLGGLLSANGADANADNFTLDGVEDQDYLEPRIGVRPSPDAIEEFKVQTADFSAEYGRASGAVVNVVTKSGTNTYHGSAYEFMRNNAFDSRNFFNPVRPAFHQNQFGGTLGGPIIKNKTFFFGNYDGFRQYQGLTDSAIVPTAAQEQGNFSGGHPIYDPLTLTTNASGQLVRQQFSGNIIPMNRISSQGAEALKLLYPMARQQTANVTNFTYSPVQKVIYNQELARVDHEVTSNDRIFARFAYNRSPTDYPLYNTGLPGMGSSFFWTYQNEVVDYTRIINPHIVNDVKIGVDRFTQILNNDLDGSCLVCTIGITGPYTIPATWGPPNISITGLSSTGGFQFAPSVPKTTTFEYIDILSISKGKHNIKTGADLRRSRLNGHQYPNSRGSYGFTGGFTDNPVTGTGTTGQGLADELLGYPASSTLTTGGAFSDIRTLDGGFFVQDDWAATRTLTLNLGLRWEYQPQPVSASNLLANWDQADNAMVVANNNLNSYPICLGCNGETLGQLIHDWSGIYKVLTRSQVGWPRALVPTDYDDFAPRLGFAWRLPHSNKTVLRGAWGKYYEVLSGNHFWNMTDNPPFARNLAFAANVNALPTFTFAAPFPNTSVAGAPALTGGNSFYWRDPYQNNWNLTAERELYPGISASVGYVGSKGVGLPVNVSFNSPTFGIASTQLLRPDPTHGDTTVAAPWGYRWYNSLQATLKTRLRFLTMLTSYTWANAATEGGGGVSDANSGTETTWNYFGVRTPVLRSNLSSNDPYLTSDFNKGPTAGIDVRQSLAESFVWNLPVGRSRRFKLSGPADDVLGGWELSGIVACYTGFPESIGGATEVSNPNVGAPHTVHEWFNKAALQPSLTALYVYNNNLNPILATGITGRATFRGPGYQSFDFGIDKNFQIRERYRLQFRLEAFNAFNHANFGEPNTTISSASFGVITATQNNAAPRDVQISLNVHF